jgi:NAD(P)-dependent dehydrogenase (short-subunit alcohol dehydrogenase family)
MDTSESKPAILFIGGAQRLGASLCRSASLRGYSVAIHYYSSADEAKALSEELWLHGSDCDTFQGNLKSAETARVTGAQRFRNAFRI